MHFSGRTIHDRYFVQELLAEGGTSEVYQAEDLALGRTVVIKFWWAERRADPRFRARFERETRRIAQLDHPQIVPLYDFGEFEGTSYLVRQYVPGGDLHARLRRGERPSILAAVRLTAEIAEGLGAAHARHIVHGDVKPGNILLTPDGHAKLTDFGIAKLRDGPSITTAATVRGTANYLAPEQASNQPITPATDVYALGAVLFELLAGRPLFTGENDRQIAQQPVHAPAPDVGELNPEVPVALARLVSSTLEQDPAARFPDGSALAAALRRVERELIWGWVPPTIVAEPTVAVAAPAESVHPRGGTSALPPPTTWPGLAGALVVLVIGIIGLLLSTMPRGAGGSTEAVRPPAADPPVEVAGATDPERPTPTLAATADPTVTTASAVDSPPSLESHPSPTRAPDAPTPVSPTATVPVSTVAAAPTEPPSASSGEIALDDDAFVGGFSAPRFYRGRTARWVYGALSPHGQMTARFTLAETPGAATLTLVGVDSENGPPTPMEIRVNDTVVHRGGAPFPKDHWQGSVAPWTEVAYPVPAGTLRAGPNTVTMSNLVQVANYNSPPYIAIDQVRLSY